MRKTAAALWDAVRQDDTFRILVWGPSVQHPTHQIRLAIQEKLRERFAIVEFSEDKAIDPVDDDDWMADIAIQERLHADGADIIYVLATSPGPKLEVLLFWRYRDIGPKMHVLIPADGAPDGSFIDKVFYQMVKRMPPSQVHWLSEEQLGSAEDYCVGHAMDAYVGSHPTGPPDF